MYLFWVKMDLNVLSAVSAEMHLLSKDYHTLTPNTEK